MSYSIAFCIHIGLCGLDLALRAKIQVCVYIYIGSALRASLYIGKYTCIWAIYAQSKPCTHIYGCHIYVYCLPLEVNMLLSFAYMRLCMLQACRPPLTRHAARYSIHSTHSIDRQLYKSGQVSLSVYRL